jgi:hypothetical protein
MLQKVQTARLHDNRHMKAVKLSAYATAAFTTRKYPWYPFLLEAELTPGPKCGWKDYVTICNRNRNIPVCSTTPSHNLNYK